MIPESEFPMIQMEFTIAESIHSHQGDQITLNADHQRAKKLLGLAAPLCYPKTIGFGDN